MILFLSFCSHFGFTAESGLDVHIFQTTREGDRLKKVEATPLDNKDSRYRLKIDPSVKHQTIVGIGSSFTESAAAVWSELSKKQQQALMHTYFSEDGAWLSLTRTHIASCDFSLKNYTYAPVPNDHELTHFSIDADRNYLLPFIKAAQSVDGSDFKIIASPWTAPPWMKTNQDWNGGELLLEHYSTFALYISKYIHAYKLEGIPIWGITPENEPLGNNSNWESLHFNPNQMRNFIANYLGPQLRADHSSVSIWMYDQNREEEMMEWAEVIYGDPEASSYVRGTAVHWYQSTVDVGSEFLDKHQALYANKELLHTEGCIDSIGNDEPIGSWLEDDWYWRAEATDWGYFWAKDEDKSNHPPYRPFYRYTRDLIEGFNHHLVGWIDWNMMLNQRGGPNHAHNFCLAPVLVNSGNDSYYLTPLYYSIAHVSKFVRPGAKRVHLSGCADELMGTAFENKDGSYVVILFNGTEENTTISIELNASIITHQIPAEALQTICIR